MKKLLFVLLALALAAYLFVGCLPVTPPSEGEGESEVTIEVEGAYVDADGKTYVPCGNLEIVVTFPTPQANWVDGWVSCCSGDYEKEVNGCGDDIVFFPNADKTVWSGSAYFGGCDDCCASYIQIGTGECEAETCIWFPVIVDGEAPYAKLDITGANCTCAGCEVTFTTIDAFWQADTCE